MKMATAKTPSQSQKTQQAIELLRTLSPESRSRVPDQVGAAEQSESDFAPGCDEVIARRIEEIESGKVEGIPYEEAMQKLRSRLPKA